MLSFIDREVGGACTVTDITTLNPGNRFLLPRSDDTGDDKFVPWVAQGVLATAFGGGEVLWRRHVEPGDPCTEVEWSIP